MRGLVFLMVCFGVGLRFEGLFGSDFGVGEV